MAKNTMGAFIAALRKTNDMTQQEVADHLHVSNKAVSRWERDECAPDLTLIPVIAELFDVTCDELLKGERIQKNTASEHREPKVEKQLDTLVERKRTAYCLLIWISIAISLLGVTVSVLTINSAGFNAIARATVIVGFDIPAALCLCISLLQAKSLHADSECFTQLHTNLLTRYYRSIVIHSYSGFAVLLLTILTALLYLSISRIIILCGALTCALAMLLSYRPYANWLAGKTVREALPPTPTALRILTLVQITLVLLCGFAVMFLPTQARAPFDFWATEAPTLAFGCCAGLSFLAFVIVICRTKPHRKTIIWSGIRNLLLFLPAISLNRVPSIVWNQFEENTSMNLEIVHYWHALGDAIALALLITLVFACISAFHNRNIPLFAAPMIDKYQADML